VTLPTAAKYADEWNLAFRPPEQFAALSAELDQQLAKLNRPRTAVRRTVMTRLDYSDLPKVKDQVQAYAAVGAQRMMLQWLALDDLDGIRALGKALL
jgi:alkanesulfonate monooxygenase SsuD/methylene tetrahydromethanopterin reductase-like flavin-dependent oxidoreductase (luciferase family)